MNENEKILIIDDDEHLQMAVVKLLNDEQLPTKGFSDPIKALEYLSSNPSIFAIITDVRMEQMNGIDLLKKIRTTNPDLPIIIITAYSDEEVIIEALRSGAYDFIKKPIKREHLIPSVKRAIEKYSLIQQNIDLAKQNKSLTYDIYSKDQYIQSLENALKDLNNENHTFESIVGKSPKIQVIYQLIKDISGTEANVLITGESGTGKELVARAIHYNSKRKDNKFVPINCGAIPENLIESELFGYEAGAFTGATKRTFGKFEFSEGGTILLDEISELPLHLQVKLLRVIQEKVLNRVGGNEQIPVNVRIIASTNKNLEQLTKEGKFREDLFYRLNVIPINIPSLRERKEDIPLLTMYFINIFNKAYGKDVKTISEEFYNYIMSHKWEGNVRELRNTIERYVVLSKSDILDYNFYHDDLGISDINNNLYYYKYHTELPLKDNLGFVEKQILIKYLKDYKGNVIKASKDLGISKHTLYRRLDELSINKNEYKRK